MQKERGSGPVYKWLVEKFSNEHTVEKNILLEEELDNQGQVSEACRKCVKGGKCQR